jgi:hypothetical protein
MGHRPMDSAQDEIRRLDWRFLLPTPDLSGVFFLGPPGSALLRALRTYGCDVVTAPPARQRGSSDHIVGQYAVCVLQSPEEADVALAARLVAPGGWLYWEMSRRSPLNAPWSFLSTSRGRNSGLRSQSTGRRLLMRSGLDAVACSWHYPDFESSRLIIPLDGDQAVRHFLRTGPAFFRSAGEWLGMRIVATALLPRIASSLSFVAQKPFAFHEGVQ